MKVGGCMYWDERGVGLNKQVIRSNLGEKGGGELLPPPPHGLIVISYRKFK